ncbi:hypothetical protein QM012_006510 [Aureobasidium pullulans]|uniref:Transcription regulator Rua1 C-terminal domain-containing protein n=1 Tax=Aureobasidium pullulans TaxID=5580 RepID=A0ABR0TQ81_AURPU
MTSSFVDPTTVRPNFCRQSSSATNQQSPFADEPVCCGNQEFHHQQQHRQRYALQTVLNDGDVQSQWVTHDAQPKLWVTWPNNIWYSQASPGVYGNGGPWNGINMPQTCANSALSDAGYDQTSPSNTDNWLLQRSYHGAQDLTENQVPETYRLEHCDYAGSYRHEYQPDANARSHHEGDLNVQYSNTGVGCFGNPSVHMHHYISASPDQVLTHEQHYPENHDAVLWDWPQTASNVIPAQPPLSTDIAVQSTSHTGRVSYVPNLSPSLATPRIQVSPTSSSCWDIDGNASLATTNITTPTDLIPDPPAELVDPPSEDMNPSDKTMVPQRRNLKDSNHLYMPRWIRGDGKQREGWCGACRPGKWLSLKRSTYWYHKNFCHGITVTGTPFPRPTRTRALADDKGWEGYCASCNEWIVLNGGKKSHTSWFRHAYKCDPSAVARSPPAKNFTY